MLKRTSFVSGLVLMLASIVFSSVLTFVLGFPKFLYTFSPDQIVLYAIFLIVSILEVIYFIKIFKAYRSREPYAYFIIYFLGILTALAVLGSSFLGAYQYLQIIKIILFLIILFAIFSFRYQKENFITADSPLSARNNALIFLILAVVVGVASYYISVYFVSERSIFPYFLPALISLALVPWWRKKVVGGVLHSFIFLPGLFIIVTHLVLQLFAFYNLFQVIQFLGGRSL